MTTTRVRSLIAVIGVALALGLGGCALGGNGVDKETNLANQRKSAIAFLEKQGGVEKIRFTKEGGKPGLGASWRANVVVTIAGVEYRGIIGIGIRGGEPMPDIAPSSMSIPTTVVFSDGSSEVLE